MFFRNQQAREWPPVKGAWWLSSLATGNVLPLPYWRTEAEHSQQTLQQRFLQNPPLSCPVGIPDPLYRWALIRETLRSLRSASFHIVRDVVGVDVDFGDDLVDVGLIDALLL